MSGSCILTYRAGAGEDRRENLLAVLARLAHSPAIEVIVVEQDEYPRLTGPLPHPGVRVLFAYNAGAFNKSWGFNLGARVAGGSALAFCDADIVIGSSLDRALALAARDFQVAKPYRRLIDLTREESVALRAGRLDEVAREAGGAAGREAIGEFIVLCGGLFVIRRDALAHIGGFDERFVGWGGEDDAMTIKAERARLATVELDDEPALHLWHPRPAAETTGHARYAGNVALLADYQRYGDAELRRLTDVQRQVNGNSNKYRPPLP